MSVHIHFVIYCDEPCGWGSYTNTLWKPCLYKPQLKKNKLCDGLGGDLLNRLILLWAFCCTRSQWGASVKHAPIGVLYRGRLATNWVIWGEKARIPHCWHATTQINDHCMKSLLVGHYKLNLKCIVCKFIQVCRSWWKNGKMCMCWGVARGVQHRVHDTYSFSAYHGCAVDNTRDTNVVALRYCCCSCSCWAACWAASSCWASSICCMLSTKPCNRFLTGKEKCINKQYN